jgi:DnaJ-domain-containing protein 1
MTLEPFQSLDSFTVPDNPDPRAYPDLAPGDRILALDTLLSAACAFKANDWRNIRRVEETAIKFAEKKYVGAYLRAFLATEKESLERADGSPNSSGTLAAKLALALLLLSPCRDEIGALERLESFLDDEGCPRPGVRRAIREVFCGRDSAWDVLGLDPGASCEEIKKAYRSLSRSLHPDATSGMDKGERTKREEEFRRANEAYELLISVTPSSLGLPPVRSSRRFP